MSSKPATSPTPFTISVPDHVLEDPRRRLQRTRWPDQIPGSGWQFGTDRSSLMRLIEYWGDDYDWRVHEQRLNAFPQYQVQLGDLRLHYLLIPGAGPVPTPLLLSHGWSGSFCEFAKVIGPLTDPAAHGGDPRESFTVVAPSMPGYAFSPTPDRPRLEIEEIATVFFRLMTDVLGFSRFAAQGGDWGSYITGRLAFAHPNRVMGIHLNMVPSVGPHPSERTNLTPAEQAFLKETASWVAEETAYQAIQGTRPQTLAYALTDSPAGLAAWITEKFHAWTDCHGDLETVIGKDDLLTNITLYWVTETINSSFWLYYQLRHHPWRLGPGERIEAPTAVTVFPKDIIRPPAEWVARSFNLQRYTAMPAGGHFAAMKQPGALVEDIRAFFRDYR